MQIKLEKPSKTEIKLLVTADNKDLAPLVKEIITHHRKDIEAPGFRKGNAPDSVVERSLGEQHIQTEVVDAMATRAYGEASKEHGFRSVTAPHVEVVKFVPYNTLELKFEFEIFPEISVPDYKKIKKTAAKADVTDEEIKDVIEGLRLRFGKRAKADRAAQKGDEVIIDMEGSREGTPVPGATAQKYPVMLGSGRFVPGFEEAIEGLKVGDSKDFEVTFPKDYTEPTLQGQKVKFAIKVHVVTAVELPKVDDDFAKKTGPFKTLAELKADVTKQLQMEKQHDAERLLTDEVVNEVVDNSKLELPKQLIARQTESLWQEFETNLRSQNLTIEKYLKDNNKSRDEIEQLLEKQASQRVKTAMVLSEIARLEKIDVTPEEVEIRVQILKGRYQDKVMQEQLDRPEARNEIADQIVIEKTVNKLVKYATK